MHETGYDGFANPVDPRPEEVRAWAYSPDSVPAEQLPRDWDLLIATNQLAGTLLDLASDPECPARRFALHCLYIYAAGGVRNGHRDHPWRRLRRLIDQAEESVDDAVRIWAHNTRALLARPDLFIHHDWYEGGLVRSPRRLP